ncbi:hypothetical protein TKK_0001586 [Trichogramma kaykai]
MIADVIPVNDPHWKLFLVLRKMIDIVTSPRVVRAEICSREHLVSEHNYLYFTMFGPLKPKMHFMTHYPQILAKNVPLIFFWGMPFERKNKEEKGVATATSCYKNLPLTIATKNQLNCTYLRVTENFVANNYIKFGPILPSDISVSVIENFFPALDTTQTIVQYKHLILMNKKHSNGSVIFLDLNDDDEPIFAIINNIYKTDKLIFFRVNLLETVTFDTHVHAYEVIETNRHTYVEVQSLPKTSPLLFVELVDKNYVVTRHNL